ncbi:MAG: glycosyltransferase family 2 protein [Elusimicrobia bacterium]|nr:glycosyltransferase family 2 protein [Elusimicrobiota bacterium]
MKRTLVILTYNEIEALPRVFDRIPKDSAHEVFAVDGGSHDGTRQFLEARRLRVFGQERRGRGEAFRVAMRNAAGEGVVFFSPDGNEDPGDIPGLFDLLDAGADMAVASRMAAGAFNEEDVSWWRPRKWGNMAFGLAANTAFNRGPYVTDTINGFRGVRRSAFERLAPDADGFVIEFQMTMRAMKLGLHVAELPTREGQRLGGHSTASSLPTGLVFLRALYLELRGKAPAPGAAI